MKVNIDTITIDPRLQSRAAMNDEAVQEYAEAIKAGTKFDPVMAFIEGEVLWLVEGFHRVKAHIVAGVKAIDVETRAGTFRDAWLYSLGTNDRHGVRRTNADKRKVVLAALADDELKEWPSRDIAAHCSVSHWLVNSIRDELERANLGSSAKVKVKSQESPKNEATQNAAAQAAGGGTPLVENRPAPAAAAPSPPRPAEAATPGTGTGPAVTDGGDLTDDELAAAAHGDTDPVAELEAAHQRIEALEAELRVLKADDAKAELSKQYHIAEDARRTASDKMNIAAQQDERLRYHGKFQAAIFKLTGTDTHAAALRVIEGWRPK